MSDKPTRIVQSILRDNEDNYDTVFHFETDVDMVKTLDGTSISTWFKEREIIEAMGGF